MALLQGFRDAVIAETDLATWEQLSSDLSQELLFAALTDDNTALIAKVTEDAGKYGFDAPMITTFDAVSVDVVVPNEGSQLFQVFKTSVQTSGGTFADIQNWDTPNIIDSNYTFDNVTGILTLGDIARYKVFVWVQYLATGNNRIQGNIKLQDIAGDVPLAQDMNYNARNATQKDGTVQINGYIYDSTLVNNTLKVQEFHNGNTADIVAARITVEKYRD